MWLMNNDVFIIGEVWAFLSLHFHTFLLSLKWLTAFSVILFLIHFLDVCQTSGQRSTNFFIPCFPPIPSCHSICFHYRSPKAATTSYKQFT